MYVSYNIDIYDIEIIRRIITVKNTSMNLVVYEENYLSFLYPTKLFSSNKLISIIFLLCILIFYFNQIFIDIGFLNSFGVLNIKYYTLNFNIETSVILGLVCTTDLSSLSNTSSVEFIFSVLPNLDFNSSSSLSVYPELLTF